MNLHHYIFTILLILLGLQFVVGQEQPKAILMDEVSKTCSEDLMSRYANLVMALKQSQDSKGIVIFYGDETLEGRNLSYLQWLKAHPKFLRLEESKILVLRGANQPKEKTQFWFVPNGADFPKPATEFTLPQFITKSRFDLGDGYINPFTKTIESSYYDLGCKFSPNAKEFAKILLQNKNLQGLIIVDNQSRNTVFKVANIIVHQLTKTYKVPRNRFRVTFRHKSEFGEAQLWLIPKRGQT